MDNTSRIALEGLLRPLGGGKESDDIDITAITTDNGQTVSLVIPVADLLDVAYVDWTILGIVLQTGDSAPQVGDAYAVSGCAAAKNVGGPLVVPVTFIQEADCEFIDPTMTGNTRGNTFNPASFTVDITQGGAAGAHIKWHLHGEVLYLNKPTE